MAMVDADNELVEKGIKSGNLWTGSDFKEIGIFEPSLAVEFLMAYGIDKGCLLWVHEDDEVSKPLGKNKTALALYSFPSKQ